MDGVAVAVGTRRVGVVGSACLGSAKQVFPGDCESEFRASSIGVSTAQPGVSAGKSAVDASWLCAVNAPDAVWLPSASAGKSALGTGWLTEVVDEDGAAD